MFTCLCTLMYFLCSRFGARCLTINRIFKKTVCGAQALIQSPRQVLIEVDMQILTQIARHVLLTCKLHPELYDGLS